MALTAACFGRDVERDGWPSVSVVMPIRNEAEHLESAVASVLAQDYPEPFDVCLAVGPSDDGTEEVAARLAEREPRVLVVPNPAGVTPVALNTAVAATTGEVVVRVDGHASLSDGYIRRAVETMRRTGAVNVGGMQVPTPETPFEEAVAAATTSRLGTGGASYRVGGAEGPVDTVYLGVFDRVAGDAVGWFAPDLIRNQDYEFNIRLREAGGTVWFDPELSVGYRPRGTWRALAKQYYEYGWWKAEVVRRHPRSIRLRQIVAAVAPPAVAASLAVSIRDRRASVLGVPYIAGVLVSALRTSRHDVGRFARTAAILPIEHGAWSGGFLLGMTSGRSRTERSPRFRRMSVAHPAIRDRAGPNSAPPDAGPAEIHLCDNYFHLLLAVADLAGRRSTKDDRLVLFIADRLDLDPELRRSLEQLVGAQIVATSDRAAVEDYARLPAWMPAIVRRNASWAPGGRPTGPAHWSMPLLGNRTFDVAYVYHPGFFLSKVVAGRSARVVMRESGYANYVQHRVAPGKALARLAFGRSPIHQVWGEERWVDEIQVVRPDQLPPSVRHKGSRLAVDDVMRQLPPTTSRAIARAFWGDAPAVPPTTAPTALVLTQPIDQLGLCTTSEKEALYEEIADRLTDLGYDIVVKAHPRELQRVLTQRPHIPAAFPIEAWGWLGHRAFDLAVSLNSTSLVDESATFAHRAIQLVPPTSFYADYRRDWPGFISSSLSTVRPAAEIDSKVAADPQSATDRTAHDTPR